ncbi:MAG: IS3 family transposase [Patescibacteria group bacterium]
MQFFRTRAQSLDIQVRKQWIEHESKLSLSKQCKLLDVNRSGLYYKLKENEDKDVIIMNEIRNEYEQHPFYGYRKIHEALVEKSFKHNIKKTQRLMALTGLCAVAPYKKTSISNKENKVYPYLLKNLVIDRPNQVWKTDITYIKIRGGFIYLVCIIDVFSRKIVGWALSPYLDTETCLEAFKMACTLGKSEILNSDQGCQFTSEMWVEQLEKMGIRISMDGKGRWADNIIIERFWRSIKYEALRFYAIESIEEARLIVKNYINFYNRERFHQLLDYKKPDEVYYATFDVTVKFDSLAIVCNSTLTVQQIRSMGVQMAF